MLDVNLAGEYFVQDELEADNDVNQMDVDESEPRVSIDNEVADSCMGNETQVKINKFYTLKN